MSKYIFDLDVSICSACGACSIACIDQNDTNIEQGEEAYRKISEFELPSEDNSVDFYNTSMACMHCDDAPCIMACPSNCLYKDEETGFTLYDNTNCIGCHSCSMACPFSAPTFNTEGKMEKCDGCIGRIKAGLKPACVKICQTGALNIYTQEEYENANIKKSLRSLSKY